MSAGRYTPMRPSKITDDYWVFAYAADRRGAPGYTGKWLVFVPAADVDDWCRRSQQPRARESWGPRSKAATARENELQRSPRVKVICVYTRDWRDQDDARRVLAHLRSALGVSWRLSYKADAATGADRYGDGSAIYVSQPGSLDFEDRTASRRAPAPGCQ